MDILKTGEIIRVYNSMGINIDSNIEVNVDEVMIIFGPNGIGKSTIAKVLCGFLPYKINNTRNISKRVLLHPQEALFLPGKVENDFKTFLYNFDFIKEIEALSEASNELKKFWSNNKEKDVSDLSGGEKQLILMLRTVLIMRKYKAIGNEWEAVILDEPTKQLSANNYIFFKDIILERCLKNSNTPIIFITHDFNMIQAIFNLFINIKNIRVVEMYENNKESYGYGRGIKEIGVLRVNEIASAWEKIINSSIFIKLFFDNRVVDKKVSLKINTAVSQSYPFHSGLYKTRVQEEIDTKEYVTEKIYEKGSVLAAHDAMCRLD